MSPTKSDRARVALATAGLTLAVVAIVFLPQFGSEASSPVGNAVAQSRPADEDALSVRILTVRARDAAPSAPLRATGTLQPARSAPLAFPVAGVVLEIARDEGDTIEAGDPLARLDPVPFESAVDQARARVEYLEKSIERSRMLKEQRALSDEEFDAQSAELSGARAQLRLAEWNLQRSVLRAPFDGFVLDRHVELGQVLGSGTPAYDVIEIVELEVEAALAAGDLPRVDLQGPVTLIARDDPRLRATGRVEHAPVRNDTRSGSVPLRVTVDNRDGRLLPGMVVEASFAAKNGPDAERELLVPLTAVRMDDLGAAVWRVGDDGRVTRVEVDLGPVRNDDVVIESGLSAGDRIVDEAPDRLRDGDAVVALVDREGGR